MFIHLKNHIKNKYAFILFILCVFFILYNSSLSSIDSSEISGSLSYRLYELLNLKIDFHTFHIFIRKCAHYTEYFMLGCFAFYAFKDYKVAILCACLVAICDETFQLLIPGRSGQISDVLLDSCGVLCSTYLLKIFHKIK